MSDNNDFEKDSMGWLAAGVEQGFKQPVNLTFIDDEISYSAHQPRKLT